MRTFVIACSAVIAASVFCAPIAAQAKTAKECRAEWQANKAEYQARKITQKDYIKQCTAGAATAQPAPAAAKTKAAQEKTVKKTAKECRAEWQANKAEYQAKKITEKDYVAQCRAGTASAQPAPAPAKPPRQTETRTAPAPAAPTRTEQKMAPPPAATAPPARSTSAAAGSYQYTTEAQAKARCGSGTVVWANLDSKIYHFAGYKAYGSTKSGAYMCERDATNEGMRAAKNEKHP